MMRVTSVKRTMSKLAIKSASGWDGAIQDAERQLSRVNLRARRLQKIIEDFKGLRASGHPWPGDEPNTESEHYHAGADLDKPWDKIIISPRKGHEDHG